MAKVIQIRGVSEATHAKLVEGARRAGKSLNAYVLAELEQYVRRLDSVEHNRRVIEAAQAEFGKLEIPPGETLRAIDEGRAERDQQLDELFRSRGA